MGLSSSSWVMILCCRHGFCPVLVGGVIGIVDGAVGMIGVLLKCGTDGLTVSFSKCLCVWVSVAVLVVSWNIFLSFFNSRRSLDGYFYLSFVEFDDLNNSSSAICVV